ncbi:MAG TPA: FkbM family methyltransferase [Pyrinomonadaceae bacterium]|nr:FkbM family methyltransferase [Pyrinomonadaceae bacterium]
MSSEIANDVELLAPALALAGRDERLRNAIFDVLRQAELDAAEPTEFREQVRWPLILALLSDVKTHRVVLQNGLLFDVSPDSRIEKALLLSTEAHPDHVWEPQTTRLLTALAVGARNVIVGGAYIGDHVAFIARAIADTGTVHAFEPSAHSFDRLLHHLHINKLDNVVAHRLGLWDISDVALQLEGDLALGSSVPMIDPERAFNSLSIDDYVGSQNLESVELIMLDTEGGEENALLGARETIQRDSPNIVFEVHRNFVDWTAGLENTSIVKSFTSQDYEVFAIRDFHNNYPMADEAIEVIPVDRVYLDGPPHGFNVLATRDRDLIARLELRVVKDVSPKLLFDKDPALHLPLSSNRWAKR